MIGSHLIFEARFGDNPLAKQKFLMHICDALRDLVLFVKFKKREKYPWRSVILSKVIQA